VRDALTSRQAARRFWERGRVVYNVAILAVAWLEYSARTGPSAGAAGTPAITRAQVLGMFFTFAVGANLCYTLAYLTEKARATTSSAPRGRLAIFLVVTLVAVAAAYAAGQAVAGLQYPDR
jgi:hypothetical protein